MKQLTLLLFSLGFVITAGAQTKNFIDQPYIEVTGKADTLITPNEIFLRILLSEKDSRDRISIEEQEQKLVSALTDIGISTEKDLTASDIGSNFKHYLLKGRDVIKTKMYTLKVTNAVDATQVFIRLEEIGISNVSIDRIDHSDIDSIENIMRTKAIVDAKERATALTKPLNQTAGPAIYISDMEIPVQQIQGRVAGIQIRGASSTRNEQKELPRIEFEKIKVIATISAKFILQ